MYFYTNNIEKKNHILHKNFKYLKYVYIYILYVLRICFILHFQCIKKYLSWLDLRCNNVQNHKNKGKEPGGRAWGSSAGQHKPRAEGLGKAGAV